MLKKIMLSALVFFLTVASSFADTITLKSGRKIEGKILERTSDSLRIDFGGITATYFLDDIDMINGEKITAMENQGTGLGIRQEVQSGPNYQTMQSSESAPTVVEYQKSASVLPREKEPGLSAKVTLSNTPEYNPNLRSNIALNNFPERMQSKSSETIKEMILSKLKSNSGISTNTVVLVIIVVFAIFILIYIYYCFCLQLIAQKTNAEPAWLAWIPIGNLFLMCNIAKIEYVWLLILLLPLIPIIGMLSMVANPVFFGYLWYNIALARNKPGWIGAITFLPIVNLFTMGYLAFSD